MDRMQATPRIRPVIGGLADMLAASSSPERTQQMQGLMQFLPVPDIAQTLDRISYGEPITTGTGMTTELRPEAKNSLAMLLGFLPIGRAAEPAAMAAGRAGERVAERVVPQVMERGGLPAEMLGAMAQGTQSPATVFHGSPHLFQKFDASKIGTGEGNQTYGYGLYLAQNRATADDYARVLGGEQVLYKGKPLDANDPKAFLSNFASGNKMEGQELVQFWTDRVNESRLAARQKNPDWRTAESAKMLKQRQAILREAKKFNPADYEFKKMGNIYQVDLPDKQIARMLDFDKPLSQQAQPVREALSRLGIAVDDRKLADFDDALLGALTSDAPAGALPRRPMNMTGEEVIKELQRNPSRYLPQMMQGRELTQAMINPAQGASAVLRQAGIPGIRYLDQGSRSNFRVQNTVRGQPYGEPVSFMTERQAQDYIKEQAAKGFGTEMLPGTSNFVVFPGMEDMLRIEQINEQPIQSLLQTLGR
jgi:hypothetical protein